MSRPPVTDWATDFDHLDPSFVADPHTIYDQLRGECPIAHTDRYHGMWIPTRYEDLAAIAHDHGHFSSRTILIADRVESHTDLGFHAPPITEDPPYHTDIRRLLLPVFSPAVVAAYEPITRAMANDLIDGFIDDGSCDAAVDYAQHVPIKVITRMLGIPDSDHLRFREWIHRLVEESPLAGDTTFDAISEIVAYLSDHVADHRAAERDDIITHLVEARMPDGRALEDHELLGICILLLLAGIDTTWSAIGSSLLHLATHPDDRRRLVEEPALIESATEEFLRAFAPVTMAREVVEDTVVGGCPMRQGDRVLLPFPAGNRDPDAFEHPDQVILDRAANRHFAFGVGIHRCLGSNLARMELRVTVQTWLERIPEFTVTDPAAVTWSAGQVRGPRTLPLAFTAQRSSP